MSSTQSTSAAFAPGELATLGLGATVGRPLDEGDRANALEELRLATARGALTVGRAQELRALVAKSSLDKLDELRAAVSPPTAPPATGGPGAPSALLALRVAEAEERQARDGGFLRELRLV